MRGISSWALFAVIAGGAGLGLMVVSAAKWWADAISYGAAMALAVIVAALFSLRFYRKHPELDAMDRRSSLIPLLSRVWLVGSLCCLVIFGAVLQGSVMGPGHDGDLLLPAALELVLTVGIALGVVEEAKKFL